MMMDDMDNELSEAFIDDFQDMLREAANHIRNSDPDAQRFIELFTFLAADGFFPFFDHLNADDHDALRCLARLFAIQIWNVTPLPSNHFRPLPLPEPKRNDPCLCGSGRKFKQCCARLDREGMPDIPHELMVAMMLEVVTQTELKQAWQHLSHQALGIIASSWMREDEAMANRALMMLDPVFNQEDKHLDHRDEMVLDAMFELCDLLDKPRKKSALIKRFMAHPNKTLQATALHRQCTILGDQGKDDEAWACFQKAQRLDPNNPSLSHLEILLLMQQGKIEQMQQRGRYWIKRLGSMNRNGELDALIEVISAMISDAPAAMGELIERDTPGAARLIAWLQRAIQTPPPLINKVSVYDDASVIEPKNKQAATLEHDWLELMMCCDDPWERPKVWLSMLEAHPELGGSTMVIDDLIQVTSELDTPNPLLTFEPLLKLAMLQIKSLLPQKPNAALQWGFMQNRPALRVIGFLVDCMNQLGDHKTALEMMEWLLKLNPNDNQGYRSEVVNAYLRRNRNCDAISLCEHYPEDCDVSICFGHALALFRQDERIQADKRLSGAIKQSPKVAKALLQKTMQEPKGLNPGLVSYGGDDEAWYYRGDARDLWVSTPGAMVWLKQCLKN